MKRRTSKDRRYRNYEADDMGNLATARRGLDLRSIEAHGDPAERARRVEFYARQVEQAGRIDRWIPRTEPHRPRRGGRFAFGDALGVHLAGWIRRFVALPPRPSPAGSRGAAGAIGPKATHWPRRSASGRDGSADAKADGINPNLAGDAATRANLDGPGGNGATFVGADLVDGAPLDLHGCLLGCPAPERNSVCLCDCSRCRRAAETRKSTYSMRASRPRREAPMPQRDKTFTGNVATRWPIVAPQ